VLLALHGIFKNKFVHSEFSYFTFQLFRDILQCDRRTAYYRHVVKYSTEKYMWEAIVLVLNEDYMHPKHTLLSRLQLQATRRRPADVTLSDDVNLTTQTNRA